MFSATVTAAIRTKEDTRLSRRPSPSRRPKCIENSAPLPMHSPSRMEVRKVIRE